MVVRDETVKVASGPSLQGAEVEAEPGQVKDMKLARTAYVAQVSSATNSVVSRPVFGPL